MNILGFALWESLKSLWRHRFLSTLSVLTIAGALFVLGLFLTVAVNLHEVLEGVQQKIAVELFLKESVTKAQASSLVEEIRKNPDVQSVNYITKAEALQRFTKKFGSRYMVGIEDNPFPPSIIIHLKPGTHLGESAKTIAQSFTGHQLVSQIAAPSDVAQRLSEALQVFMTLSAIWAVILLLLSVLIIVNTIKLAIYSRRDTIAIMRLVGATPAFIRLPLTLEGVFHGLLAGTLSASVLWLVCLGVQRFIRFLVLPPDSIFFAFLLAGVIFGSMGSWLAVKRFL